MVDAEAMRAAFKAHTEGQTHFTRRIAITIAEHFDMHPMQVVKYYERMGLLRDGSTEWFREYGGFTKEDIATVRADLLAARSTTAARRDKEG